MEKFLVKNKQTGQYIVHVVHTVSGEHINFTNKKEKAMQHPYLSHAQVTIDVLNHPEDWEIETINA